MNTLLIIGYVWPEPQSSAAGSHMLSLIRCFKRASWRVIFSTAAKKTEYITDLHKEDIETQEIKVNDSHFDQFITKVNPTAVLFDRFLMEEQFGWRVSECCPNALRILDTEDLQCLRDARHSALKQNRKFNFSDLNSDLTKREIASIYRCDISLIISSFEMSLLTEHFKIAPQLLIHLPFMINLIDRNIITPNFEQRKNFIAIGNLRHAPNWDSILYLQKIWPLIRKKLPKAELHIYGAYTPPKATALNNSKTGFLIKDRAGNVNEVMSQARVCLAPLRFGAGIKGKLIDAMISNTPNITTNIGAEGMSTDQQWPGLIEDNLESIVDAAVSLYEDKELWTKNSELCDPLLNEVYDKERLETKLMNIINHTLKNIEKHRNNNFIGLMLGYHSLKSTKYMSKWIEEKNKSLY